MFVSIKGMIMSKITDRGRLTPEELGEKGGDMGIKSGLPF
jgi:hypothetical protein